MGSIFDHSKTMDQFAAEQRRRARAVGVNFERIFRQTVLAVGGAAIQATPVKSGHARNNWLTTTGAPGQGTPNAPDRTGSAATTQLTNTGVAVKVDETAYVTNNVPYIGRLNAGHSKQAPAGFIEKAVEAGRATVRAANPLAFPNSGDSTP